MAYSLIVARFTNSLVKSRPLKEVGAEQVSPSCYADAIGMTPAFFSFSSIFRTLMRAC